MKWIFLGLAVSFGVVGLSFMFMELKPEAGDFLPMSNERRKMLIEAEDENLFI